MCVSWGVGIAWREGRGNTMSERELNEASLCEEFVAVHSQPFFFLNLKALPKGQKGKLHERARSELTE